MDQILYLIILCFSLFAESRAAILPSTPLTSLCYGPTAQGGKQIIGCTVRDGQVLDYREVRDWTAADQLGEKFHVSIECFGGGIYLPWPYRARNVLSLRVHDCRVLGMFSEWNATDILPDELESLEMTNTVIHSSIQEMYERISNLQNLTPDFDCGQHTLINNIMRNVNYHFDITVDDIFKYQHLMDQLISQDPNALFIKNRPKSYKCVYPNLRYLENSGNKNIAKLHFKILEDSTEYPSLEEYDLSNNSFSEIPTELRNIDFRLFPKLRRISFAENQISNIQLKFPAQSGTQNLIFIDLSGNRITYIPKSLVNELNRHQNVIIDVRFNPLHCDCSLIPFRQYLINRYMSSHLNEPGEVTCQTVNNQNQVTVISLLDSQFETMFCRGPY